MCGIIGILGSSPAAPRLVEALKRLEYRGYDSAGVATLENGAIKRRRAAGKLANLERELAEAPLAGVSGIGHTRWATHGAPTTGNAHPHATDKVAIVHNGIIENFRTLREELIKPPATASRRKPTARSSPTSSPTISTRASRPNKPPSPPSAASTAPSASPCCSRATTTS